MSECLKNESLDENAPVTVVFRSWQNGDILALFPFVPATVTQNHDECMSYEHQGQHGAAEYTNCIEATTAPTVADAPKVGALVHELIQRGYTLNITSHEALAQSGRLVEPLKNDL